MTTQKSEPRRDGDAQQPALRRGEHVYSNGLQSDTLLTICITIRGLEAEALITNLRRQFAAERCALFLYHEGSIDRNELEKLSRLVKAYPGPAMLVIDRLAHGVNHARKRLTELSATDWLLFLDGDLMPDDTEFLRRYLSIASARRKPALYSGGLSLQFAQATPDTALCAADTEYLECKSANERCDAPGPGVFATNILVHRYIVERVAFYNEPARWGWDYVDWGLSISYKFRVEHINNSASKLTLVGDKELIELYGRSGKSFARAVENHPNTMRRLRLYRLARLLSKVPLRSVVTALATRLMRKTTLPIRYRLLGLRLYRAALYSKHI